MINTNYTEETKVSIGYELKSSVVNLLQSVTSATGLVKSTLDNTTMVVDLLGTACKPLAVEFKVDAATSYMKGLATLEALGATKEEAIKMLS